MKIAISGTHGSGKSVIAMEVVAKLKKKGKDAIYMPEVARDSPYLLAGEIIPETDIHLFGAQIEAELRYQRKADILVCDRSIFDRIAYAQVVYPDSIYMPAMKAFSDHFAQTYDYIFMPLKFYDTKSTIDRIRPKGEGLQSRVHKSLVTVLERFYPDYISIPVDTDPTEFLIQKVFRTK